jgi:hypothetical protein
MPRRAFACALFAWVLAAGTARADVTRFSSPSGGEILTGGENVVVRWEDLPPIGEFELLLRIGGDPRATVRLTRSLVDGEPAYRWRVPNLPAHAARLVLRGELDDREVEVASSETFGIAADPFTPLEEISLRDGELWDAPQAAGLPGGDLAGGSSERVSQSRANDSAADASRSGGSLSTDPRSASRPVVLNDTRAKPSASTPALLALPGFVPKRN